MVERWSKFKVGDRVRVVRHCNYHGDTIKMKVPVGDVRRIVEETGQLAREGKQSFLLEGDDWNFYTELNLELVSGPIRTVTRREFVPGRYGIVTLWGGGDISVNIRKHTPTELREAAHIFNQIAEVLEEQAAGEQQKEAA